MNSNFYNINSKNGCMKKIKKADIAVLLAFSIFYFFMAFCGFIATVWYVYHMLCC